MDRVYLNGSTLMTTPTQRVLAIARKAGYAGIEARAERLLKEAAEVRAAAEAAGPGDVLSLNGISLRLRTEGRADAAALKADLEPRLAVCRALGARYLLAVAPRAPGLRGEAALEGIREGLELVSRRAADDGVGVAFEFLGFADCPLNTPALAGRAVDGMPGVDVVLDSCHWHASGGGSLDGFPIDRLAVVHLNDAPAKPPADLEDADRLLPGEGVIDLARLVSELRARGFAGPWSVETFNPLHWSAEPDAVAREGRAAVERLLRARPGDRRAT